MFNNVVATLPGQSFGSLSFLQSWEQEQTGLEALKLTLRASHLSWLLPRPGTYFVLVICLLCHDEALNCVSFRLHKSCVSVRKSGISATDGQIQRGLCRPAFQLSGRKSVSDCRSASRQVFSLQRDLSEKRIYIY